MSKPEHRGLAKGEFDPSKPVPDEQKESPDPGGHKAEIKYLSRRVADLEQKPEDTKLPPFLAYEIRRREAYLTLIRDLTEHLAEDWSVKAESLAKARVNEAIARSLKMWI